MTATYDLIASNVLTTNVSSVTFSSLPSTYRDLVLVIRSNTSNNGNPRIRFNSDTGSNYSQVRMTGNGSTATSATSTTFAGIITGDFAYAGSSSSYIVQIMDYSATDKHKTVLSRANESAGAVEAIAGRWANTAAVTTLTIDEFSGGTFSSGGTFYLYGIVS
jgi:hypothetical protein